LTKTEKLPESSKPSAEHLTDFNPSTIQPVDYQGQRVITFEMVDRVHERPLGTASRNFKNNRDKFVEGEDFYLVDLYRKDELRLSLGLAENVNRIILLTESGYLLLCKSLTDDRAWLVQKKLVKVYFRAKEVVKADQDLKRVIGMVMQQNSKMMQQLTDGLIRHDRKMDNLEKKVDYGFASIDERL